MGKAKPLKRLPDVISIDGPLNKKDLPKGTKIKTTPGGVSEGYYGKNYLKVLNNKRTGPGITGKNESRITKIYRQMRGGGMGLFGNPENR